MNITAIDFETANQSLASVCAVGISTFEDGVIDDTFYSLIKPEENVSSFSYWNMKVHGIKPSDVEDAPSYRQVFEQMEPYFYGHIVCAHNANFDMTCIKKACENCCIPSPHFRYFDTVQLARKLFPELGHHRLDDVCKHLDIELNHHHAGSDAYACLMIVVKAMEITNIYDIEVLLNTLGVNIKEI